MSQPVIIFDPSPRSRDLIFSAEDWKRLNTLARVISHDGAGRMDDTIIDEFLPQASLIIGQTDLPAERLDRAEALRAIINVEGNFYPNVDYKMAFARGIRVLGIGPAFSLPVAEMALGLAIDTARGITRADRAFRAGGEGYGKADNAGSFLLTGADMGFVGFGHLGRSLLPLLQPFRPTIRVFDPWVPPGALREHGLVPDSLEGVLSKSKVTFVLAGVTEENYGMIGAKQLALIPDGAAFLLMSRAPIVDWDAFLEASRDGRFRAATDVFPQEPVSPDDPVRRHDHMILSAHRAGGIKEAFLRIGEMVADDAGLLLSGLPPARLQSAHPETVARLRSTPGQQHTIETK